MESKKNTINALIEFFIELPFNLGLPTGLYAYDKPKQIRLNRDMYYLQKGNELENIRIHPFILTQYSLFNKKGIINEEYSEFPFKRKMKTVLFKKYPISFEITIEKDEFLDYLKSGKQLKCFIGLKKLFKKNNIYFIKN